VTYPERHLPFFSLLEAVQQPGCFLCRIAREQAARRIDSLLYESVTDPIFRQQWRDSRSFCHRHAWMLAETADAFGIAILYLDLLDTLAERILDEPPGVNCPLCEMETRSLKGSLYVLVTHWADPELRAAIDASDGLCGPHYRTASRLVNPVKIRHALLEVSLGGLHQLKSDLRQLVNSYDYRRSPPTDERVKQAWKRAIEKVVGARNAPEGA
jgi:hypothetical protein